MATVDDLLRRIHRQAFALHPTGEPSRQLEAHLRAWVPLATNASRVLEALDPRPGQDPDLYALLRSVSRAPTTQGQQRADPRLAALALTVGVLGDVVTSFPTSVAESGQAQRSRLQASIRAALYAAARTTLDLARAAGDEPRARIVREIAESTELAAMLPPAARVSTLGHLTVTSPTPHTVEGAVHLWLTAARGTFGDYQLVTGVALQEAAGTLSLLTRVTAETLREAASRRIVDPDVGRALARLMADASRAWHEAAAWPSSIQLGGRAYEHRHATSAVRDALTGPPLARLTLREKVSTLRAAASAAAGIGELQSTALAWLVSRGGLWVAHERVNLRPPGVERRHVKLDWEVMPCGDPAGMLLANRARDAQIVLVEAVGLVTQALLLASGVQSRAGELVLDDRRIAWEAIATTTGVSRLAPSASPETRPSHRIPR